jgi:hypothetical protein
MSQFTESPCKGFTAGAALAKYLRVIRSSGKLAAAGIGDKELGTLENATFADGDSATVRLRSAAGTCKMVASKAIAADAEVWTAASGKISDTGGTGAFLIGTALEAAGADGEVIEVLRMAHGDSAHA